MKKTNSLTNGLAILLAVLILIFLATAYLKYSPDDRKTEKGKGKLAQFFESSQLNRDYFRLAFLLGVSAAVGLIFVRRPEYGVLSSCGVLAYELTLNAQGALTKHPMVILVLTLCHIAGALISCGYAEHRDRRPHCSNAGLLCTCGALITAVLPLYRLIRMNSVAELTEKLREAGILVQAKFATEPDLVQLVYLRLVNSGTEEARELAAAFSIQSSYTPFIQKYLESLNPEELGFYLRLCILLLGTGVLILFLRTRLRLVPVLLSLLPPLYCAVQVHAGHLSSFPMFLLCLTVASLVSTFTGFDRSGALPDGHAAL